MHPISPPRGQLSFRFVAREFLEMTAGNGLRYRILLLAGGKIIEEGSPAVLLKKPDCLFLSMTRDAGLL